MHVNAVIQARTGSSRLPGKVLRDLGGRPVLDWVVRAARLAPGIEQVVVATSAEPADDALAERAAQQGAAVVRGSEDDVLSRFVQAVDEHPCDAVVRLTGDCPLLDPALIGLVVAAWRAAPEADYVATTLVRTLPRGLDVELARVDGLREVASSVRGHHRAHVTSGIYTQPERFALHGLVVSPASDDLRVTLDTQADLELLAEIVAILGDRPPAWRELVALLRSRPDLVALNSGVVQKPLDAG